VPTNSCARGDRRRPLHSSDSPTPRRKRKRSLCGPLATAKRRALLALACGLALLLLGGAAALSVRREKGSALPTPPEVAGPASSSTLPPPASSLEPGNQPASVVKSPSPAVSDPPLPPPVREETSEAKKEAVPQPRLEKPAEAAPKAAELPRDFKRRRQLTEADLIKQISEVPAVALDRTAARVESNAAVKAAAQALVVGEKINETTLLLIERRPDLAGLPLRRREECRLPTRAAAHFDDCARKLRGGTSYADGLREQFKDKSNEGQWLKEETVPVLMQMLGVEAAEVRLVLAEQLGRIPGKRATAALVQLALFDLSPKVRYTAIGELAHRDAKEYRQALLKGFDHPWPVIADHAAEALVALKRTETVATLVQMLDKPDPAAPFLKPAAGRFVLKELVRVNHLSNCLLCHPPSLKTQDKLRGLVPSAKEPLGSGLGYGGPTNGIFVRADITYLKQDFSLMLKMAKPGKWPDMQRFDCFVRERFASRADVQAALLRRNAGPHEQRQAMFFALRELTGKDLGPHVSAWKEYLRLERVGGSL
jgi:hypothetical protein